MLWSCCTPVGSADGESREVRFTVPLSDSKTVHLIENRGQVHDRDYSDDSVTLHTTMNERHLTQLRATGPGLIVEPADGRPLPGPADARAPWRD